MTGIRALILFILLIKPCLAQDLIDTSDTPRFFANFEGYKVVYYRSVDLNGQPASGLIISLCDKILVRSIKWHLDVSLYHFPDHYGKWDLGVTFRPIYDINGDGKGDIIIKTATSGDYFRSSTYIYSLDTSATLIGDFDGINTGLSSMILLDLDNDSQPELIFSDEIYYQAYLVWKWDGTKYRLANYKLKDGIIKLLYHTDSTSIMNAIMDKKNEPYRIANFNPQIIDGYLSATMNFMIMMIYIGETKEAEMFLDASWAKHDKTKSKFNKILWDKIKSSHYGKELLESDW